MKQPEQLLQVVKLYWLVKTLFVSDSLVLKALQQVQISLVYLIHSVIQSTSKRALMPRLPFFPWI